MSIDYLKIIKHLKRTVKCIDEALIRRLKISVPTLDKKASHAKYFIEDYL